MYTRFFKRAFDVSIALFLLPLFLMILLPVSIMIFIFDRGPIFYSADRLGKNGVVFKMYKFRTMMVNAPDIRLSDGSTYNAADDPRVTWIGKHLRRASIDEFPQLVNIILGQMSFIGPRPDPPDWLDKYNSEDKILLSVLPGITGYNQAYFRNGADGKTKMKNDVFYARNISLKLDFEILIKTVKTVLFSKNLYVHDSRGQEVKKDLNL